MKVCKDQLLTSRRKRGERERVDGERVEGG